MKDLKDIILEKLHLDKNVMGRQYTCHPKKYIELRSIIKERLDKDKNADLNDIDVSNITSFYDPRLEQGLFVNLDPHNIKIDEWNVSNVTNMKEMFYMCRNFNCDLSNWNVSNVKNMQYMFMHCYMFNSDLSDWDVSNVKDMREMFYKCDSLKNLPNWYK